MIYADDTQVYAIVDNKNIHEVLPKLETCIRDILSWSTTNHLKLNPDKTEVLHFVSRFRDTLQLDCISIGDSQIRPAQRAKNLGVIFQNDLSLSQHINNVCRSASFALHKIGQLRQYLDTQTTEKLVHAFVTCRIDYGNSLFYGLPRHQISKLQRIQNSAARLVSLTKSRDHITPVLSSLHWLPVQYRINYKVLLLTYKCIHGFAPLYLQELISNYKPLRDLRSSSQSLLNVQSSVTHSYGDRAFSVMSAKLWNDLPSFVKNSSSIERFKSNLKTHLFTMSY